MDGADPENVQPQSSKQHRKRKVSRIIRCGHFNESSDSQKFVREKLMLYTPWRDETNDVLGGFSTFYERYEFLQEDLKVHMQVYEPYVDEVKHAETAAATDEAEQWDLMAPGVQKSDRIDEETGSSESAEFAAINPKVHGRTSTYD